MSLFNAFWDSSKLSPRFRFGTTVPSLKASSLPNRPAVSANISSISTTPSISHLSTSEDTCAPIMFSKTVRAAPAASSPSSRTAVNNISFNFNAVRFIWASMSEAEFDASSMFDIILDPTLLDISGTTSLRTRQITENTRSKGVAGGGRVKRRPSISSAPPLSESLLLSMHCITKSKTSMSLDVRIPWLSMISDTRSSNSINFSIVAHIISASIRRDS
mmetsp:Transcript_29235/g.38227  ORF Transcript_29235/g.38227 Transcript_29235/m.38227 type:complete len:218 (-) Transcript_29235:736-1389(-)